MTEQQQANQPQQPDPSQPDPGQPTYQGPPPQGPPPQPPYRRLTRTRWDAPVSGVCGGIARQRKPVRRERGGHPTRNRGG